MTLEQIIKGVHANAKQAMQNAQENVIYYQGAKEACETIFRELTNAKAEAAKQANEAVSTDESKAP
jgi:hypothetical protein